MRVTENHNKEIHIAPMMKVSNHEFRYFMRLLTKRAVLWTEMVSDEVIYYATARGKRKRSSDEEVTSTADFDHEKLASLLYHDRAIEPPIVCQIGGTQPTMTAIAAQTVESVEVDASDIWKFGCTGYRHINLNMGCPSTRVKGRQCGAILMKQPERAASLAKAVTDNAPNATVSIKCRIGVDDFDNWEYLEEWIEQMSRVCRKFILHARKCLLKGLSPTQNRSVPPLNYPLVYRLCERFPDCEFWINGGIRSLIEAKKILVEGTDGCVDTKPSKVLQHAVPCAICNFPNGSCNCKAPPLSRTPPNLRGCMLGRAAMDDPAQFWDVDRFFYGETKNPSQNRREVLDQYRSYIEKLYPRRCCDDKNSEKTIRIPSPNVPPEKFNCTICGEVSALASNEDKKIDCRPALSSDVKGGKKPIIKITHHIMERCLKPVRNLFVGLEGPSHKAFKKACDHLAHDLVIRNCGPAYALRRAMLLVQPKDLDLPFVECDILQQAP